MMQEMCKCIVDHCSTSCIKVVVESPLCDKRLLAMGGHTKLLWIILDIQSLAFHLSPVDFGGYLFWD